MGHDSAAMSLLPEKVRDFKPLISQVRSYHAATFATSLEDRIQADAQHLLDKNLVEDIDTAVEMAIKAINSPRRPRNEKVQIDRGLISSK